MFFFCFFLFAEYADIQTTMVNFRSKYAHNQETGISRLQVAYIKDVQSLPGLLKLQNLQLRHS